MSKLAKIGVFCGSSMGKSPIYEEGAVRLGKAMLERGIGLVYGGGNRGIMGTIAHTIHEGNGIVIGVLPKAMDIPSVTRNTASTEVHIAKDMHSRKSLMYELSDAFIAMPGGIGTVEEIAEVYTWRQLDYHNKNIAFYNVGGFWDPFLAQLDKCVEEGFLSEAVRKVIIVSEDPEEILRRLEKEKVVLPNKLS